MHARRRRIPGRPLRSLVAIAIVATLTTGDFGVTRAATTTERISVDAAGGDPNASSDVPSLSGDGRFVAFTSYASDLVSADTNATSDVFVRDRQSGTSELVSVDAGGGPSDGASYQSSISRDGRFVVFASDATDLVAGDTNGLTDVFVRDRQSGVTERVSLGDGGTELTASSSVPTINADGRFVVYESLPYVPWDEDDPPPPQYLQLYRYDRQTGSTEMVSVSSAEVEGNADSRYPGITPDGRYVAFWSMASDLTAVSDDPGGNSDIFLRDLVAGTTEQISLDAAGGDLGGESWADLHVSLTDDARFVAYSSNADEIISGGNPSTINVVVRDRATSSNEIASRNDLGEIADGGGQDPHLSADGRSVAFWSAATNLVADDTNGAYDVFVRDREAATTVRASLDSANQQAGGYKYRVEISADGGYVGFLATGPLVPDDTNDMEDIYVRDLSAPSTPAAESASGAVSAGGSVSTGGGVADPTDPIETTVTTPVPGTITIVEEAPLGPPPPDGYTFLGQQVSISGPVATAAQPLVIAFTVDGSILGGADETTLQLFRNGVAIAACAAATAADPDPCIELRERLPDGDVRLQARTSAASLWNVGRREPYTFSGFLQPVDNAPTLNKAKAGAAIPVKFRLGGDQGLVVFAGGYPRIAATTCDPGASVDPIEQTVVAGASSLRYDASSSTYTYTWKTDKAWAGSCRELVVRLADGSEHRAKFQFTK